MQVGEIAATLATGDNISNRFGSGYSFYGRFTCNSATAIKSYVSPDKIPMTLINHNNFPLVLLNMNVENRAADSYQIIVHSLLCSDHLYLNFVSFWTLHRIGAGAKTRPKRIKVSLN